MKYIIPVLVLSVIFTERAAAGNSYVLPDGISRSPAVTLHCATGAATAIACGTILQPLVVTQSAGGATAANQTNEISIQEIMSQALGSPADPVYSSGPGSMVSLLKGLTASLQAGILAIPAGGQPVSRTLSNIPGLTSTTLFPINAARRYLAFQAPQANFIWVNFLGGVAGPNLPDCVYFPAGTFYESGSYVNRGSITVYAPILTNISAWEG